MDWSAVIYASIGGGLGGLIGALIRRNISHELLKKVLPVIFIVLGYQLATSLYKNMLLPRIIPIDTMELEASFPSLTVLRENNSDDYTQLIKLIDQPARNGKMSESHLVEFREKFYSVVESRRKYASPDLVRKQNVLTIEQYEILKLKAPEICTAQIHGRPFPSLAEILDEEYQIKEQEFMKQLFAVSQNNQIGNKKRGEKLYDDIIGLELSSLNIQNLEPAEQEGHRKICQLMINVTQKTNLLDDSEIRDVAAYIATSY